MTATTITPDGDGHWICLSRDGRVLRRWWQPGSLAGARREAKRAAQSIEDQCEATPMNVPYLRALIAAQDGLLAARQSTDDQDRIDRIRELAIRISQLIADSIQDRSAPLTATEES